MSRARRAAWVAALCACSATAQLAWADEVPDKAQVLLEEGRVAYRDGRFADSVKLIKEAYDLKPEPVLLYHLARAYEGQGELELAEQAYSRYLREEKQISDRGNIEQKIASLKKLVAERKQLAAEAKKAQGRPAAEPDQKAKPPPDSPKESVNPFPWVLFGSGALICGAGGVMGGIALSKNDDANEAPNQKEAVDAREDADAFAVVATVGYVTGGVLAGIGLIWGIVDVATLGPAEKTALRVRVGPTAAQLSVRF